jgi:diguanylate cyclase (GGDEF)-like protein
LRHANLGNRGQKGIRHAPNGSSGVTRPRFDPRPAASASTPLPDDSDASTAFGPDAVAAARVVLDHLQAVFPLTAWAVFRCDEGDCLLEAVAGSESDGSADAMPPGTRMAWGSMICSRMVAGAGPNIAPDVRRVPAYAAAPITRRLPVGAYAGVPVRLPNGQLIGSICGLDPSPQPESFVDVLPVLRLAADLLGRTRAVEVEALRERARAEEAERRAVTDALTGISNRLGWDEALASEQARASRRGLWTGLVSVDLDELKQINDRHGHQAGDGLLLATAESLQAVVRREDVLARVGGDEFAVLVSDCDAGCLDRLIGRLRAVLDGVGVRASVGAVSVPSGTSLLDAWHIADQQMYAEKHRFNHRQLDLDLTDGALRTG